MAFVGVTNVVVDPYSVFGTGLYEDGASSNERFKKVNYLFESEEQYRGLIMGSSRSGMTDPRWVEEATGLKTYNLSVFSGKPSDMSLLYGAYRTQSKAPEVVMLGVDAMAFLKEKGSEDLSRRHHPEVGKKKGIAFWSDYVFASIGTAVLEKLNEVDDAPISFDWESGTYRLSGYERQIAEDHQAYKDRVFGSWELREYLSEFNEEEWSALEGLLRTLEKDDVEVKLFLQPIHRQWAYRINSIRETVEARIDGDARWINLSRLGSEDDDLWYEQRHYRENIAKRVVDSLFRSHLANAEE